MSDKIELIKYDILSNVQHCFTTRTGGVSQGGQKSLNLSFSREASAENVRENYRRVANELGVDYTKMTRVPQKHTDHVLIVKEEHTGIGISKAFPEGFMDYGYDAMITNVPGIVLCTSHADCVPVFLYDEVHNVVGAVHSGWRGTAKKISLNVVNAMLSEFDSSPGQIKAVIGPSIGIDKFECDKDVFDAFSESFKRDFAELSSRYIYKKGAKFHISVSGFVYQTLIEAGVAANNIYKDTRCTFENESMFFSHRRDKGDTGVMAAVIKVYE